MIEPNTSKETALIPELLQQTSPVNRDRQMGQLLDLVYVLTKNLNGGDLKKSLKLAHVERMGAWSKSLGVAKKVEDEAAKLVESTRAAHRAAVKAAFAPAHRISVGGKSHGWDEVLEFPSNQGVVKWVLADDLVDGENLWDPNPEIMKAKISQHYLGFAFQKHLSNAENGRATIDAKYVAA